MEESPANSFPISTVVGRRGVVVFTGLTAYDTQRIKADYVQFAYAAGPDGAAKRSVLLRASFVFELHQSVHDAAAAAR